MQLSQSDVTFLVAAIQTADKLDINSIIIEPESVRAIDDGRTVLILSNSQSNKTFTQFGTIYINRVSTFVDRWKMMTSTGKSISVDAQMGGPVTGQFVQTLIMRAGRNKVDFRCSNPSTSRIPRQLVGNPGITSKFNEETISMLGSGKTAMATKLATLYLNNGELQFILKDVNSDELVIDTNEEIIYHKPGINFVHKYSLPSLLSAMKGSTSQQLSVNDRGILTVPVNGLDVHIMPLE